MAGAPCHHPRTASSTTWRTNILQAVRTLYVKPLVVSTTCMALGVLLESLEIETAHGLPKKME